MSTTPDTDADGDINETDTDTASCTAPKVAYGGGGVYTIGGDDAYVALTQSFPSDATNNRDWTVVGEVIAETGDDGNENTSLTAYVLCGNP